MPKIEQLLEFLDEDIDLFICSASFEERCLVIPSAISSANVKCAVISESKRNYRVQALANRLENLFADSSRRMRIDFNDPLRIADTYQAVISRATDELRLRTIVVDITTFTHEALLILLVVLRNIVSKQVKVTLLYTPAMEYAVGLPLSRKWLSRGVREIRTVVGFSGIWQPSSKTHIVVLAGLDLNRVYRVIEQLDPSALSIGFGHPIYNSSEGAVAAEEALSPWTFKVPLVQSFEYSALDPVNARNALDSVTTQFNEMNTVLLPLGSKLSTIAAAALALEKPALQIRYPQPRFYRYDGYSQPSDDCVVYHVPYSFWCKGQP